MAICHPHNLLQTPLAEKRFGIRVQSRSSDPFRRLVGNDWEKEHWFATREERDTALAGMSSRYVYFRPGDRPSLEFEKLEKP